MNSVIELPIEHENELPALSKFILDFARDARIFLFYAPMGAGKTTFIKAFCATLGSTDSWSSPTYSVVNEYHTASGPVFHMDLYRLQTTQELLDLGIEEYIHSGNYCFIEWPERVEEFIDQKHIKLEIEMNGNIRYLRATKF